MGMSENLTETDRLLLNVLKSYLNTGETFSIDGDAWKSLFSAAQKQFLLPIVYDAVRKQERTPEQEKLFASVQRMCVGRVSRQIIMESELRAVLERMRAEGLHPITVKGCVLAALYPQPDLRQSSDFDLLVKEDEFDACHAALLAEDMETECGEKDRKTAHEVTYKSRGGSLVIELHKSLFTAAEEELNRPFTDVFEHTEELNGCPTMEPHRHLLFLLFHAYKHFFYSGTGIRNICDIGLWMKAYGDRVDSALLYRQCREAHAETFAAAVFRIADDYLGFSCCPPEFRTEIDPGPMLADMLDGGIYGSDDLARLHSATVTLNSVHADRNGEKAPGLLRSVFPKRSDMVKKYPYLEKHPVLLPAAWMQRIFGYFTETRKYQNNRTEDTVRIARQRLELLRYYRVIDTEKKR